MMDSQWPEHFELSYYGSVIAEYRGTGLLRLQDGNELACSFITGQISDGSVLAICNFTSPPSAALFGNLRAICLSGITEDGYQVMSVGDVYEFEGSRRLSLSRSLADCIGAYKLHSLLVQIMDENTNIESVSYGLTNLTMMGYQWSDEYNRRVLPISIYHHDESVVFTLMRVDEYDLIAKRMQRLHLPQVTCTAKCDISQTVAVENADNATSELCLFLSVARGSLIQWLYRENIGSGNQIISRIHHSHYTSYYSSYQLIDPIESGDTDTLLFVDCASRKFNDERNWFEPNRWAIYSYISAKEGKGYLETQGVAMAIALEALKDIMLRRDTPYATEYYMLDEDFNQSIPQLAAACDTVLQENGVSSNIRQAICNENKLKGLNRRSFSALLRKLLRDINLTADGRDIELFVKCRNSLVHRGRFYCVSASEQDRVDTPPKADETEEFLFLMNFLDRIYLKLFGYGGRYEDWSTASTTGPTTRVSV